MSTLARGPDWPRLYQHELVGRVVRGKIGHVGVVQGLNTQNYGIVWDQRVRVFVKGDTFTVRFIDRNGNFSVEQTMKLEHLLLLCSDVDIFVSVDTWSQHPDILDSQQNNWHPLSKSFVRAWAKSPLDQLRGTLRTLMDMVPLPKAPKMAVVVAAPEAPAQPEEAMDVDEDEVALAAKNAKKAARNAKERAARTAKKAAKPEALRVLATGAKDDTVLSVATNRKLPADLCAVEGDFALGTPDLEEELEVASIMDELLTKQGHKHYLVKWLGYELDARALGEGHWEEEVKLQKNCKAVLTTWIKRRPAWWTAQKNVKPPAAVSK